MPQGSVYVGRPTKWGNPFRVGTQVDLGEVESREEAVNLYLRWWEAPSTFVIPRPPLLAELLELCGKDLACWCRLDVPCHADVLLMLVSSYGRFRDENPHCYSDGPS